MSIYGWGKHEDHYISFNQHGLALTFCDISEAAVVEQDHGESKYSIFCFDHGRKTGDPCWSRHELSEMPKWCCKPRQEWRFLAYSQKQSINPTNRHSAWYFLYLSLCSLPIGRLSGTLQCLRQACGDLPIVGFPFIVLQVPPGQHQKCFDRTSAINFLFNSNLERAVSPNISELANEIYPCIALK